jgi:hypothetical protein
MHDRTSSQVQILGRVPPRSVAAYVTVHAPEVAAA